MYGISVAAELAGMDAQRLRLYEARGLLEPDRTPGGTRRYSADDLDRLRCIGALLGDGLNLAGIAMVLNLQDENDRLHHRLDDHTFNNTEPPPTPSATSTAKSDNGDEDDTDPDQTRRSQS
nr:MerR family transcriptional regulator [Ornithinicoccus soli]